MQANRGKLTKALLALLLFLIMASSASAEVMSLWYGDVKKGNIEVRMGATGGKEAAADQVVSALGLMRSGATEGLVVVMNGSKIELWDNASVIRVANDIVPLTSPIVVDGGHWWVESKALLSAFDTFLRSIGRKNGLRWMAEGTAPPVTPVVPRPPVTNPVQPPEPKAEKKVPVTSEPAYTAPAPAPETTARTYPSIAKVFTGKKRPVVVVDAGHGGHDPGAVANGLREKDLTLKSVKQLGAILAQYGVDVRYTRTTDVYLPLAKRSDIANRLNADVFISMHCNAMPKGKKASGLEYYLMALPTDKDAMRLAITENREVSHGADPSNAATVSDRKTRLLLHILGDMQQNDKINESTALAEMLHRDAMAAGLPMRKVRQAPFFVLRGAAMPAVLVEMGYLTDAAEARKLNTEAYRETICRSIAAGVVKYIREHPAETR